jgi:drug/metabolite transporter (DMT)-like permease
MDSEPPQLRVTLAFITLVLIWSSTPLAVVLSLRDLEAVWSLAIRMLLAAVVAQLILRASGLRLDLSRNAVHSYLIGALSMFGAMFFTYLGARHLPSGLISILFGASPLLVGILSVALLPGTRLPPNQWLGMALGLVGLVFMFAPSGQGGRIDPLSVFYVVCGVSSYAISAIFMRRRRQALEPLMQTTGALWVSLLGCLLVLPFFHASMPTHMPHWISLTALLYSASFGSIAAMLCYFYLLRRVEASTVALTTLINPVFALGLGMLINHERFQAHTLAGMALIFGGLLLYYARELERFRTGRRRSAVLAEQEG